MAAGNRLDISLLGTSFTIRADEDEAYLKRILWYLERKIEGNEETHADCRSHEDFPPDKLLYHR